MCRFKFRHWNKVVKTFTYYDNPQLTVCLNDDYESGLIFPLAEDQSLYMGTYDELQQSTGLKDKNDRLIYEGDIVTDKHHNMEVYYEQNTCSYCLKKITKYVKKRFGADAYEQVALRNLQEEKLKNHQLEVIGNIYENPELLKEIKED